ncbi:MAG: hypothetical protein KF893_02070 [Caldilineaceae bacterium]|nr:hypothetical protein [Caldilineaceae bacterium]
MQSSFPPTQQPAHFTPTAPREQPDRGEILRRVSVVTWAVVGTMAASLFLRMPTFVFELDALGSPITISITDSMLMAFFIAALAASGAESVISAHPFFQEDGRQRHRTWPYWALPAALSILTVLLIPQAPTRIFQVAVLGMGGFAVAFSLFSLYITVDPGVSGFRRSRLLLNILAYSAALVLFLLVYQTRTRSLLSGTLVAGTAALLAAELLRTNARADLVLSYAGIVGLILGQVTWALNYWPLPGVTGGLLLLLIFYLIVGMAQQGLQGRLTRRVFIEFILFGVLALILIAVVGPGF